ncbi:MAG: hypothetical protein LEGION0403_FIIPPAGN_02764 [Legionella sp.]|uniref:ankyrin repeat domain-containing protein n=1 Tax=Legionella sp. TaxID=459 RepID=UPI003D0B3820
MNADLPLTTKGKPMEPYQADWTLFNTWFEKNFSRKIKTSKPNIGENRPLLNAPNANGQLPLHIAALEGNTAVAKVLLYLGADSQLENKQKQHPLFSTLVIPMQYSPEFISNKIKLFQLLLQQEKNIAHQDKSGNTILHQMVSHTFDTEEENNEFSKLMSHFLEVYPDLANIANNAHSYPIHTAILNAPVERIWLLLELKGSSELTDSKGQNALHYACLYGDREMIEACCAKTKDINKTDKEERTPLMFLAQRGLLQEIQHLIKCGAQTNLSDRNGHTVLHYAVQSASLDLVSWLVDEQKIEVNPDTSSGQTPLDLVDPENNKELYDFLLDKGAHPARSSPTYP